MFRSLLVLLCLCLPAAGHAQKVAVTMSNGAWTFTASLTGHIEAALAAAGAADPVIHDAGGDRQAQLDAVADFIGRDVDVMIVNLLSTDDGLRVSRLAEKARIPIVYVNVEPINSAVLPEGQSYVGSDETESGTLEFGHVCDRLGGKGTVSFLIGDLVSSAARSRTLDYYALLGTPRCAGIEVLDEGFANWSRDEASARAGEWIAAGRVPDAFVANNDDMALGAIDAIGKAGLDKDRIMVTGIDATAVALQSMGDGVLDATVLQNARGQAESAVATALALARGDGGTERIIYVPFELVTPENLGSYLPSN
ncbi:substrate-binding domain-containing protein [Mangrovicoccus sp. HB161399]|uniref:substrate-binding domain-containing protein n=1 Tax=Mangrovicoccus sp. HB161399 TaxID=2720392 RepID=UPI001557AF00|nr:substrate-binding domain-containing protein [Mangrovicoccus sp. HB161399]